MTLLKFLGLLSECEVDWYGDGFVRGVQKMRLWGEMVEYCPITAVYYARTGKSRGLYFARGCGVELGMSESLVGAIIRASDGSVSEPWDRRMRERLLMAVGREETSLVSC